MSTKKTPEAATLRACMDVLGAHRIWWMRMNVGAVKSGNRFFRFGRPGMADILAMYYRLEKYDCGHNHAAHVVLWIECKSETGRQRPEQKEFQAEVEGKGHSYLIVRKPEDLIGWLKEHGCI